MNTYRRSLIAAAGAVTAGPLLNAWAGVAPQDNRLVLSSFSNGYLMPGVAWRGFSDRVMGGISNAGTGILALSFSLACFCHCFM